jgi:hypothetical protein
MTTAPRHEIDFADFFVSAAKENQDHGKPLKPKMPKKSAPKSKSPTAGIDATPTDATPSTTLATSPPSVAHHEKFAFSQLMRQMAQKYQDKSETAER